jgi:hypothetical protein
MKWDILLLAEFLYELLIAVAFLTPQMKIAMCCLNTIAKILQDEQQRHTISPTAQSYQMQPLATQKFMLPDEFSYFLFHFTTFLFYST